MAYQSWSVVFGEQPSAAKWNILGSNDASFNDGTGIASDVVTDAHLVYGKLRKRQGGSSSVWRTYGTNNYDYDATNTFVQLGYTSTAAGADTTITFPVAFNQKPLVWLTVNGGNGSSGDSNITENAFSLVAGAVTTTTFVLRTINTVGSQTNQSVAWLAWGQ
jgi:hypothetical protein